MALRAIGDLEDVPTFPSADELNRVPAGARIVHPGPLFSKLGASWANVQRFHFGGEASSALELGATRSSG
jgi:hypothetical protein